MCFFLKFGTSTRNDNFGAFFVKTHNSQGTLRVKLVELEKTHARQYNNGFILL